MTAAGAGPGRGLSPRRRPPPRAAPCAPRGRGDIMDRGAVGKKGARGLVGGEGGLAMLGGAAGGRREGSAGQAQGAAAAACSCQSRLLRGRALRRPPGPGLSAPRGGTEGAAVLTHFLPSLPSVLSPHLTRPPKNPFPASLPSAHR